LAWQSQTVEIIGKNSMAKINSEWVRCPICGSKTRSKLREDTILKNYPLYCPKCKQETLIEVSNFEIIVETVMCKSDKVLIASNWYSGALVRGKFMKLDYSHVEYVLHCLEGNTSKIKNIKKYLLAALFNAPSTINGYYRAEVNHDMPWLVR